MSRACWMDCTLTFTARARASVRGIKAREKERAFLSKMETKLLFQGNSSAEEARQAGTVTTPTS